MESKFQTSFIPKKALVPTTERTKKSSSSIGFFSLIGIAVFMVAIAGGAGVYVWKLVLTQKIEQNQRILAQTEKEFDPALIEDLKRLDSRIEAGKDLMNKHIAVSGYFELLQDITLKTVRFKSFQFTSAANKYTVTMQGEAESFAAIALQSDAFAVTRSIKNPVVSNLNPEQSGLVSFDFTAQLDQSLVLYKNRVGN